MPKPSLSRALEEAYAKAESEGFTQQIVVGKKQDFPVEDLFFQDRPFSLEGDLIVIYQFPSPMHDRTAEAVGAFVSSELNSALGQAPAPVKFGVFPATFPNLYDTYNCSTKKSKSVDAAVYIAAIDPLKKRDNLPIAIEVSFRNEPLVQLLWEGCHILASNSDVCYAILVKIIENKDLSEVEGFRIVVLKRIGPLVSDLPEVPAGQCRTSPWYKHTPVEDVSTEELVAHLPVECIYDRTAWRSTFDAIPKDESFSFDLCLMNHWYGRPLYTQAQLVIKVKKLFATLFEILDRLKRMGQY